MIEPTDAEIRLALAFLRMVREARKPSPDDTAGKDFGEALFECPGGFEVVAELIPSFCEANELPDVLAAAGLLRVALLKRARV